jgi:PST family polysaccharide transporter
MVVSVAGGQRGQVAATTEKSAAARSIWWVLLESCGLSALSFAAVVVLARFLTPVDFGVAALALGFVQLLGVLATSLFHDAIIQRPDLRPVHVDSAFWLATLVGALLSLWCWLGGDVVARVVGDARVEPVLGWMSLRLLFSGVDAALAAELRRGMQFKALATRSLLGRLIGAIAGIIGAALGFGVWALVAQQIAMAALAAIVLVLKAPRRPAFRLSLGAIRDLASFGVASLINQLLGTGSLRLFTLLAGSLLGAAAVGYISAAFRFVDVIKDALSSAANQLAMPLLSRRQGDAQALKRVYCQASEFAWAVSIPIFAGFIACADDLVVAVIGPRWLPSAPVVQVWAAVAIVLFIRLFNGTILTAVGRPMMNVVLGATGLAISVLSTLAFGHHGIVAAVAAWSAPRIILTLPLSFMLQRRTTGMTVRDQLEGALAPVACATLMAICVFVLGRIELMEAWTSAERLAVLVPLGALIYSIGLFVSSRGTIERLCDFMLEGLRRPKRRPAASAP